MQPGWAPPPAALVGTAVPVSVRSRVASSSCSIPCSLFRSSLSLPVLIRADPQGSLCLRAAPGGLSPSALLCSGRYSSNFLLSTGKASRGNGALQAGILLTSAQAPSFPCLPLAPRALQRWEFRCSPGWLPMRSIKRERSTKGTRGKRKAPDALLRGLSGEQSPAEHGQGAGFRQDSPAPRRHKQAVGSDGSRGGLPGSV